MPTRARGFSRLCLHSLKLPFPLRKGWQKLQRKTDNTHTVSSTKAELLKDRVKRKTSPDRNWTRRVLWTKYVVSCELMEPWLFSLVLCCSFDKQRRPGLNLANLSHSSQHNEAASHWIRQTWCRIQVWGSGAERAGFLHWRLVQWMHQVLIGACVTQLWE